MPDRKMVAAIYNVFDGLELLPYSVSNIAPCVDGIIFVYQDVSNTGDKANVGEQVSFIASTTRTQTYTFKYHPDLGKQPADNERMKREIGRTHAQKLGFTHFIDIDCDEFYHRDEFNRLKTKIINEGHNGAVIRSKVYFAKPTLTIGTDVTLVPFIHKIDCYHVMNRNYPFAWTAMDGVPITPKKQIRIDPTRQLSFTSGIIWDEMFMHHYSWVRKDYTSKIKNSSASANIKRSNVLNDLLHAKAGEFCEFYGKYLTECPNVFGLPEWQNEKTNSQDIKTISGDNH